MTNKYKLNHSYIMISQVRKDRKAPFGELNGDKVSDLLYHAMNYIEEAFEILEAEDNG